jgi:hypothetical protein
MIPTRRLSELQQDGRVEPHEAAELVALVMSASSTVVAATWPGDAIQAATRSETETLSIGYYQFYTPV